VTVSNKPQRRRRRPKPEVRGPAPLGADVLWIIVYCAECGEEVGRVFGTEEEMLFWEGVLNVDLPVNERGNPITAIDVKKAGTPDVPKKHTPFGTLDDDDGQTVLTRKMDWLLWAWCPRHGAKSTSARELTRQVLSRPGLSDDGPFPLKASI
jgi:hypothetical protein